MVWGAVVLIIRLDEARPKPHVLCWRPMSLPYLPSGL